MEFQKGHIGKHGCSVFSCSYKTLLYKFYKFSTINFLTDHDFRPKFSRTSRKLLYWKSNEFFNSTDLASPFGTS